MKVANANRNTRMSANANCEEFSRPLGKNNVQKLDRFQQSNDPKYLFIPPEIFSKTTIWKKTKRHQPNVRFLQRKQLLLFCNSTLNQFATISSIMKIAIVHYSTGMLW
jgi:hypothetical protein